MKIVERQEAIAAGAIRYFTGKPCLHGHISERNAKNRECIQCCLQRSANDPKKAFRAKMSAQRNQAARTASQVAKYRADPAAMLEYQRLHRQKNLQRYHEREKESRERFREQRKTYAKDRYYTNQQAAKAASRKWAKNNKPSIAARTARGKAARLKATPPWVDHKAIAVFYRRAAALTRETGILHEVDHIHPLQGETVCGLHVPWNLQILTKSENSRKKNKLIDASLAGVKP